MVGSSIPKNVKILNYLIASGCNPRVRNNYGQTPLFWASKKFINEHALKNVEAIEISQNDLLNP